MWEERTLRTQLQATCRGQTQVGKRTAADSEARGKAGRTRGPREHNTSKPPVKESLILPSMRAKRGMYVPTMIRGQHAKLLIDTGATDTFLSSILYYKISPERRPHLKLDETRIRNADGTSIVTLGSACMELQVGKTTHPVYATFGNIPSLDGILGMDFLLPTCGALDFRTLELTVNGEKVKCDEGLGASLCARVVVGRTTRVPPGHEAIVPGHVILIGKVKMSGTGCPNI